MSPRWALFALCLAVGLPLASSAQDKEPAAIGFVEVKLKEPLVFDKHVFPILAAKCTGCHDKEGGLAENNLDLLTVASIQKGGKRGPALVAGKGAESLLVKLAARGTKPIMPPKDEEPLTPEELSLIKAWIDQGAKPGENLNPAAGAQQPVVLGPLPPGIHPVYSLDLNAAGTLLAAGRANQVFVYDTASGGLRAQLTGHQDLVQSVKLSPDGQWLAAGGFQLVKLWKVPQDKERANLAGHGAAVRALVVSPDGKMAVSASEDKSVRLWSLADNKQLREFAGHGGPALGAAFSPDGSRLATACADKQVRIFQVGDAKLLKSLEGHSNQVTSVAFHAGGNWLASGCIDNTIRLWDLQVAFAPPEKKEEPKPAEKKAEAKKDDKPAEKKEEAKKEAKPAEKKEEKPAPPPKPLFRELKGHGKQVRAVVFVKDFVISASEDGTARVWNLADGKELRSINHGADIRSLDAAQAGEIIATGGADNQVKVWKLADGAALRTITGATKPVSALAFSRDGKELAVGAEDNSVRVWDSTSGQLLHTFYGHTGPVQSATFGGDSNTLLTGSADKSIRVWDASGTFELAKDISGFKDRVVALDFSPDGKLLATGGGVPAASGELLLIDVAKGERVREFTDAHSDTVFGVAFSADGKLLSSGAGDKFVKVHEVATGKHQKSFEGHTHHVLGVAWKSDGKELSSAGADNAIKVWNYETGEQARTVGGHSKQVTAVTYIGATDRLISACADRQTRKINAGNGGVERGFGGAADFLYTVDSSADGKLIAAAGQEGKIFLWNGDNAQLLRTLEVPPELTQTARK